MLYAFVWPVIDIRLFQSSDTDEESGPKTRTGHR